MGKSKTIIEGTNIDLVQQLSVRNHIGDFKAQERIFLLTDNLPVRDSFSFRFSNCDFSLGLDLTSVHYERCQILFANCRFGIEDLNQFALLQISSLQFESCTFGQLSFTDVKASVVKFRNCVFDNINVYYSPITEFTVQNPINENSEFYIDSSETENCKLVGDFRNVELNKFQNLVLDGNVNVIELNAESFKNCHIGSNSRRLELLQINLLKFQNSSFEGDIYLNNLEVETFRFDGLSSAKGSLRLNGVVVSNFLLIDCAINYLEWSNVRFMNYRLQGSNLIGLNVFNSRWPEGKLFCNELPSLPKLKKINNKDREYYLFFFEEYVKEMEAYRLLKVASQNNKNEVDALDFYRLEMRVLWTLRRIKGERKVLADNILLGAARVFSDFTQNWWIPLIWLLFFHLVFMLCLFRWNFDINSQNMNMIDFVGEYFDFLNPIHKQPNWVNTNAGKFTDFLIRIYTGYFIYHFVKASRKFGKI